MLSLRKPPTSIAPTEAFIEPSTEASTRKPCAEDAESYLLRGGAATEGHRQGQGSDGARELDHRDWAKMTAGGAAIAFSFLILWEIAVGALIHPHINPTLRFLYFGRAIFTAGLVTAFALRYASRIRRRLEAARLRLLADEMRLADQERRMETTAGLAAILRIMGHEIKNPLNGMRLHCAILKRTAASLEGPARAAIEETSGVIEGEIKRLNALLEEYMAYGKAKSVSMSTAPVDIGDVMRDAALVHSPSMDERGITLDVSIEGPRLLVEGDASKLAQVLHNLLRNSIEATPAGGHIDLSARLEGSNVVMSIQDTGPGFSDPESAFRPFFTTKSQGSGLGLAVVHDVVRAHRGEARAYNAAPGGGARVDIRLPKQVSP